MIRADDGTPKLLDLEAHNEQNNAGQLTHADFKFYSLKYFHVNLLACLK